MKTIREIQTVQFISKKQTFGIGESIKFMLDGWKQFNRVVKRYGYIQGIMKQRLLEEENSNDIHSQFRGYLIIV